MRGGVGQPRMPGGLQVPRKERYDLAQDILCDVHPIQILDVSNHLHYQHTHHAVIAGNALVDVHAELPGQHHTKTQWQPPPPLHCNLRTGVCAARFVPRDPTGRFQRGGGAANAA
jgi:hypothetical protein